MPSNFIQEIEDVFTSKIEEKLDSLEIKARVDLYHGETSSPDSLIELIGKAHNRPHVLVAVANKQTTGASTDSRVRNEVIPVDVFIAAKSHRSAHHSARIAYDIISGVEKAMVGFTGMLFEAAGVREREAVRGGDWARVLDQPDFALFQMQFEVSVIRDLDA